MQKKILAITGEGCRASNVWLVLACMHEQPMWLSPQWLLCQIVVKGLHRTPGSLFINGTQFGKRTTVCYVHVDPLLHQSDSP